MIYLYSRKVIGCAISEPITANLVCNASQMVYSVPRTNIEIVCFDKKNFGKAEEESYEPSIHLF